MPDQDREIIQRKIKTHRTCITLTFNLYLQSVRAKHILKFCTSNLHLHCTCLGDDSDDEGKLKKEEEADSGLGDIDNNEEDIAKLLGFGGFGTTKVTERTERFNFIYCLIWYFVY